MNTDEANRVSRKLGDQLSDRSSQFRADHGWASGGNAEVVGSRTKSLRRFYFVVCLERSGYGRSERSSEACGSNQGLDGTSGDRRCRNFGKALIGGARLPPKADTDALHIAIAAVHRIDYLLTWNCRHIDNIDIKDIFVGICLAHNLKCPKICSPEDLLRRSDET
jgi:hypothetical protein